MEYRNVQFRCAALWYSAVGARPDDTEHPTALSLSMSRKDPVETTWDIHNEGRSNDQYAFS